MKISFEGKVAAAAVAAALLAGGAACCSVKPSVDPNDVGPALAGEEKTEETGVNDRVGSTEGPAPEATGEQSSPEKPTEGDDLASESTGKASEPASPDPVPPAREEPSKRWVEETEKVWVVDSPAWTESIPVYESWEISVCNICDAEITGSVSAHAKEHMLAGEGSRHRSEVVQVLVGTRRSSTPRRAIGKPSSPEAIGNESNKR